MIHSIAFPCYFSRCFRLRFAALIRFMRAAHSEQYLARLERGVKQRRFQFPILRQYRCPKPPAQQGVGNRLDTDTFLPIVQGDTVFVDVVTALMHQFPRSVVLAVIHDRDRFSLVVLHSDSSHTHRSRGSVEPPGGCPYLPVPAAPAEGADGYLGGS